MPCRALPHSPQAFQSAIVSPTWPGNYRAPHSFPTRRSSDLGDVVGEQCREPAARAREVCEARVAVVAVGAPHETEAIRSEEHTSELQSRLHLVCRLLLEKKKKKTVPQPPSAAVASRTRSTLR